MKPEIKPICFTVKKVESTEVLNSDIAFNSENAFAVMGYVGSKRQPKILNFCSSVYKLISNKAILEPLMPVLEKKFKHLNIDVINDKDAQFSVKISPVVPSFSKRSEVIRPAIIFANSYDGKVLAQATGGLVRYMVDKNGNVFQTYSTFMKDLSFSYTFKHSDTEIYSMERISKLIDEYLINFYSVESQIKKLKKRVINDTTSDGLDKVVRQLAAGTVFPLKEVEETIERVAYESEVFGTKPNLWTVYNSMNYILENSESALTAKARIDAGTKIYANVCERLSKIDNKSVKATVKGETVKSAARRILKKKVNVHA